MAIKEIFHFNEAAYKQRVHNYAKEGSYQKLAEREVIKRRRIYSTKVKIACCTLLLFPTGGATAVGLFIGIRQRAIARKKYHHVVDAMTAHGFPLPVPKKKDKLVPLAINIVIYSLTLGLMFGLEEVGLIAADETAAYGMQGTANLVDPTMAGEAQQFVANPGDFVQGLLHGAHTQATELHGLITPQETMVGHAISQNLEQPISETSYQYMSGETAGAQLAPVVEQFATVNIVAQGMERITKSGVTDSFSRKPVASNSIPRKPVATSSFPRKPVATQKAVVVTGAPITIGEPK